ncbi:MAG: outer membrane beta-barrel protein [Oligoflexia bacterium]|nr:outer membrane beta-barrel protein [Oligoflexia bacterium]
MANWFWIALATLAVVLTPDRAAAGFEVSTGFSFNRSNYSDNNYSWTRRWGATLGYHFSDRSGIELTMQDVVDRTFIGGYEDTTFHDRIYSVDWYQALAGKNAPIQPFFKIGVGQLNRDASGSYAFGGTPPLQVDQLTGVLGAGLRIYLTRTIGLKSEATSYLSGGRLSTWKDNIGFTLGISIYL